MENIKEYIKNAYLYMLPKIGNSKILYESMTEEDLLGEVILRAFKKFKDKKVTQNDVTDYIKKVFYHERFFLRKRLTRLILIENYYDFEDIED